MFGAFYTVVYAATFTIGDPVEVAENNNVWIGPEVTYLEITDPDYVDYEPTVTRGKVLDGPTSAKGYVWWRADFAMDYITVGSLNGHFIR
jgi:hypothetical protein